MSDHHPTKATTKPRLVPEIDPPFVTVGVYDPAPVFVQPRLREREIYEPLFEWLVNGQRMRYRVPAVARNGAPDCQAMQADLRRAYRSTLA